MKYKRKAECTEAEWAAFLAGRRKQYADNPNVRKLRAEQGRKWAARNRDKTRAYRRKWDAAHPDKRRAIVEAIPHEYKMFHHTKNKAKARGIKFNLELRDIQIPDVCPVLGIPMRPGSKLVCDGSPTLDRLIPSRGYVKGNVRVISKRANQIKSDATARELKLVYEYVDRETRKPRVAHGTGVDVF